MPSVLLEALAREPNRPSSWIEAIDGTLLMSDLSGFTRMSERLAEIGKEGAERLTDIINSYFHRMLDIAAGYGGANLKFGGDALLLLFKGPDHARRAVATALSMQRATRQFPAVRAGRNRIRLSMSVGVHSGRFWFAVAGVAGQRMQHFILGPETSYVAQAEAVAERGEVMVSRATLQALGSARLGAERSGFSRVLALRGPTGLALPEQAPETADFSTDLTAFLPPPVVEELRAGDEGRGLQAEHRKTSVVFIEVLGVNELIEERGPKALLDDLQAYASLVVRSTNRCGGFLASNDISTQGIKLIVLFGAPVAHEDDAANSFRLALELAQELPRMELRIGQRIGINSGFVFATEIGSPYRREYTVMGDAVNIAARLMAAAAPAQIIVSQKIAEEAGPGFELEEMASIPVKGKTAPIAICALRRERAPVIARTAEQKGDLVGREAETDAIRGLCRQVERGRRRSLVIAGEPGIGKSHLVREAEEYLKARGWNIHRGQCHPHTAANPFSPWVQVLNSLFDTAHLDSAEQRTEKALATLRRLPPELEEMAPLLNPVLNLAVPENQVVSSLDSEARRRRLFDLVAALLAAAAQEAPLAVVMEDLHSADPSSLQLLNHVDAAVESGRLLLCLTLRPVATALQLRPATTTTLSLGELPEEDAASLIAAALGLPDLPAHVVQELLAKARGNPLFLHEIARSIRQSGGLDQLLKTPSFRLAADMAAVQVPDRIQTLIMSRLDTLRPYARDTLRSASVIGTTFDLTTLRSLLDPDVAETALHSRLLELVQMDLVDPEEASEGAFSFKHALIQEVAYDSLPFSRRRELHSRTAAYLEEAHAGRLEPFYGVLVHHYRQSGSREKTFTYALKAGDSARLVFANEEAIEYYRSALTVLERKAGHAAQQRSYVRERIGDAHGTSGRHLEAIRAYSKALREWRTGERQPEEPAWGLAELSEESGPAGREAKLCFKIGTSYERHSYYDLSLKWLESAQGALPSRQLSQAVQITVARAKSLLRKGLYEEAIRSGREGLSLSRRLGDARQRAFAHDVLAIAYIELGYLKRAVWHNRAAVRLYHEVGDLPGQASSNGNLGACYQLLGYLDGALYHYEVARKTYERMGEVSYAATAHNNIGEVLMTLGRLDEALAHFLRVVETYERTGGPLSAAGLALVNLCRAYQRQRRYEAAWERLRQGMEILRRTGDRMLLAEARLQQAELELETGSIEAALGSCRQGLRESNRLGSKFLEARALRILGRLFSQDQGRHAEAEAHLRQSVALAARLAADYEKGLALLHLGELYSGYPHKKGAGRRGAKPLREAAAIFQRLGAAEDLSRAIHMQADFSP